jgi:hypothetical protein
MVDGIVMTRASQKEAERRTLRAALAALGLHADREPIGGETPDFMVPVSGRTIGVEITMYRSGDVIEDGTGRRQVENEWELLKAAADGYREAHPEFRDINVGLMFAAPVPPRRQHTEFIAEIVAFASEHADKLSSEDLTFWPPSFTSPLMRQFLRTLYLRHDQYAEWYSSVAFGYVARPGQIIADIVAEKSSKKFRPADEQWLVIQCGARISEMVLDLTSINDFASVPSLAGSAFSRVILLGNTGAYEWQRASGWRRLTGQGSAKAGSNFDELKSVLNDPEWLADPDGKASKVAEETLREIRRTRDAP